MTDNVIIDMHGLTPDRSYQDCLKACGELGLVEIVQHGTIEYGRITQAGVNALCVMLQIGANAAVPGNMLKES